METQTYKSVAKTEIIKDIPSEEIFKSYKEYVNFIKEKEKERDQIKISDNDIIKHNFITENLTNICNLLNNLKIKNEEIEHINYRDFVDIFYKNITVLENVYETESESDSDYCDYEDYDY